MSLLGIAEPLPCGPAPDRGAAVGIDLGTTHSLVAAMRDGVPVVLPDDEGRKLLPSVVHYLGGGGTAVGYEAREAQPADPFNVIASVKRLMGRAAADLPEAQRRAYRLAPGEGMARIETRAGLRSPVEASAEILSALRLRAERALGGPLAGAVITVPAYFDDAQRQATRDAARLAGLEVLRLLNEPTAAALAHGLEAKGEGVFAVYDLGGGTFDISILRLSRGVFEVLAVGGDSALGGDDIDWAVYHWALAQAGLTEPSPPERSLLLQQARQAKECLTAQDEADLFARLGNGRAVNLTLGRGTLESLAAPLIAKTLAAVRKALRDAGLSAREVEGVVLVGGATRMPAVRRAVAGLFGREPSAEVHPDEAVALGAALQADALAGHRRDAGDWLLLDVTPLSLGLETMGGLVERIIPRNSTLPVARAQDFTTFKDGQTSLSLHVVQGERERVSDCRSLARFELRGLPPMAAGTARIRVTFQVDTDGLLNVSAREQSTGIEAGVAVKPSYGLAEGEIAAMLRDAREHAAVDAKRRALAERRVEAEKLLESLAGARRSEGEDWLTPGEAFRLEVYIAELKATMQGESAEAIRGATEALNRFCMPMAARRMDQAVQRALQGREAADFA